MSLCVQLAGKNPGDEEGLFYAGGRGMELSTRRGTNVSSQVEGENRCSLATRVSALHLELLN